MLSLLRSTIGRFRLIALAEGISFLILLFIAMPLKYIWDQPLFVRYFGSVHGLLFVLYILLLALCMIEYRWSIKKVLILGLISLIPFGAFYADKKYLRDEQS
jgi:integral membrane protein